MVIETVMLVDDDDLSNFILKKMIENAKVPVKLKIFNDPANGLLQLPVINPDIIFLDFIMPGITGKDFLQMMHDQELHHKVYILSSSISESDRESVKLFLNVQAFLTKPLNQQIIEEVFRMQVD